MNGITIAEVVGAEVVDSENLSWWAATQDFMQKGGVFLYILLVCSVIALAVILYKSLQLKRAGIIPRELEEGVETYASEPVAKNAEYITHSLRSSETALSRLIQVALTHQQDSTDEVQEAVQANAREEVVKMHSGIPVLEVMITICPLLGLLGTASGLVTVFSEAGENADYDAMKVGIARALGTTIAGIAVAVPAVIAHSFFCRKVETMSARLEVLLGKFVTACRVSHSK